MCLSWVRLWVNPAHENMRRFGLRTGMESNDFVREFETPSATSRIHDWEFSNSLGFGLLRIPSCAQTPSLIDCLVGDFLVVCKLKSGRLGGRCVWKINGVFWRVGATPAPPPPTSPTMLSGMGVLARRVRHVVRPLCVSVTLPQ